MDSLIRTEWGLTLTGQEERQNFLKSQPSNQKQQEVATQIEIYESSEYNFYFSFINNMKIYFFNL